MRLGWETWSPMPFDFSMNHLESELRDMKKALAPSTDVVTVEFDDVFMEAIEAIGVDHVPYEAGDTIPFKGENRAVESVNGNTIYVVGGSTYEGFAITAVFDDEAKAEAYAEAGGFEIQEYEPNPPLRWIGDKKKDKEATLGFYDGATVRDLRFVLRNGEWELNWYFEADSLSEAKKKFEVMAKTMKWPTEQTPKIPVDSPSRLAFTIAKQREAREAGFMNAVAGGAK